MATLADARNAGTIGATIEQVDQADEPTHRTIVDALRDRLGADVVHYERGTGLVEGNDDDLARAVEAVAAADMAILVLGERSGLTDDSTTGEFRDRRGLGLMGRQQELLERAVKTGTPVVLVVVSGRPLALPWAAKHCASILLAWVPGDAGPDAIADVIVGHREPRREAPGDDAPRCRTGPAHLSTPSVRRSVEPARRPCRRTCGPPLALRTRALVHDVLACVPEPRPVVDPDRSRNGDHPRAGHQRRGSRG